MTHTSTEITVQIKDATGRELHQSRSWIVQRLMELVDVPWVGDLLSNYSWKCASIDWVLFISSHSSPQKPRVNWKGERGNCIHSCIDKHRHYSPPTLGSEKVVMTLLQTGRIPLMVTTLKQYRYSDKMNYYGVQLIRMYGYVVGNDCNGMEGRAVGRGAMRRNEDKTG